MIKEKDLVIGETAYRIQQMTATEGVAFLIYLTKTSGGLLKGLSGAGTKGDNPKVNVMDRDISGMVEGLLSNLDEENTVLRIKKLCSHAVLKPKNFDFDVDFQGNYGDMAELIFEVLKLNYADSFKALKKKVSHIVDIPENLSEVIRSKE